MTDVSVIGRGTRVRGRVAGAADLEIRGYVEGEIGIDGDVVVDSPGLVLANVAARRIVVRGAVRGDLVAEESLVLEGSARVVGDVRAPSVTIAEGALVRGNVQSGDVTSGRARAEGRASSGRDVRQAVRSEGRAPEARPGVSSGHGAAPGLMQSASSRAPTPTVPTPSRNGSLRQGLNSRNEETGVDFDNAPTVARVSSAASPMMPVARSPQPPPPVVPSLKKGIKGQFAKKRS